MNIRPSSRLLASFFVGTFCLASAALSAPGANDDVHMMCVANDHEILNHTMVFQKRVAAENPNQHLIVRRLSPVPPADDIRPETVFIGGELDLDAGLPLLSQSSNGPELGLDAEHGVEIVYTKETPEGLWHLARLANNCPNVAPQCWAYREIPNTTEKQNRWGPFATGTAGKRAWVVYYRTPGPRDVNKRVAWRVLEDPDPTHERVIADANVSFIGPWARIGGEDFIMALYGPPDGDRQVALYDVTPPFTGPRLTIVTGGPGNRTEAAFRTDPATGRATIFATTTVGATNVMEVWQRIGGTWSFRYSFDAAAIGETNPALSWVQSPEPFVAGGKLYLAILTSDTDEFSTTTQGNLRIARIDPDGPPTFFKVLNDESIVRKRTEPEIHYTANDGPVVFYTMKTAEDGEEGCDLGNNTMRRARTAL